MRIRFTLDITRGKSPAAGEPEGEESAEATDGGAQIESAPTAAPGWNPVGFVLPSTNEDDQ